CQGWGIHGYYGGSAGAGGNIVKNNYILYTGSIGILFLHGNNNVAFNNVIQSPSVGVLLHTTGDAAFHNTIVKGQDKCIWILGSPYGNSEGAVAIHNVCWANAINAITDEGIGSTVTNNLFSDPRFVNEAGNDFHLMSDSPAIDQGYDLSGI